MPSETMNFPGFFADDASLPREINGFWKSDNLPNYYGTGKTVARASLENLGALECQPAKSLELYQSLMQDQKVNESFGMHAVGTNKAFMLRPDVLDSGIRSNLNVQQKHHYAQVGRVDNLSTQNESSLFSHSLSELVSRKLRSSSNNVPYDQSVDTFASNVEEEEPLEPLEEIEAQTIGNLLPTDDDLFNEMTDKMNNIKQFSGKDDIEELDVFSSLGGLDLGNDGFVSQNNNEFTVGVSNGKSRYRNGSLAGGNPFSAYPSRTIFARNINSNIEDSELRAVFEKYGDIQAFYTSCKHRGFVMISYYDIRAATNAKQALQNVQLRHHKLDIHYSIPKDNSDEDINQGALVILNLDSSISIDDLRQIFCGFGDIKEIRETSTPRSQHKIIEFYDLRAAGAAFRALNGSNIGGKQINLELNRAGGSRCLFQRVASDFEQDECRSYAPQSIRRSFSTNGFPGTAPHGGIISSSMDDGTISGLASAKQSAFMESAFGHGISSSVPNSMSSLLRVDSSTNQSGFGERGQFKYDIQGTPNSHPHSLPDNYDDLKNIIQSMGLMPSERTNNRKLHKVRSNGHLIEYDDGVFGSAVNGSSSLSGHHYGWGNSHNQHSPGVMWSNSPTFTNGISLASPTERLHGSSGLPSPIFSSAVPVKNQHMGSAPSANGSLWERRRAYAGKSSDAAGFHSGSLGSLRVSDTTGSVELVSPNMLPHVGGNYMELSVPPKGAGFQPHHQRSPMRSPLRSPMRSPIFPGRGQMSPVGNSFESPNERSRSRRNEGSINPADKKQYELDLDRILQGEDKRTTLMIKNIPNKYTSKMLLAAIDEHHRGTYDFIYLPIDFKNKCNVGYAFINMIDPCQIVPFFKAFNGKKWEKFNSEKIASIAYARIQGKAALVAHFQNSSLMNEDKRCRPILFNSDGPNAGDQVPFPTGINVRTRPAKSRTPSQEENQLTSSEEFSNGDTSGRDSD
ncbi:Protein MEI2-like 4 [Euphorbia peplus]|nr:Protein MEI2-like 4 [Euphorbia peplus]